MTDLEREAREEALQAALPHLKLRSEAHFDVHGVVPSQYESEACVSDFISGYLAAVASREQEIDRLRAELAKTKLPIWMLREEHEQEVSALRARVAELEGMVPKWAEGPERYRLEKLGWCVAGGEMVWHRKPGNIEASWHCLMVPPIPLPETKA